MNKIKTLAEYQQLASRTCALLSNSKMDYLHMKLGIKTEIGETLDIFKKYFAYGKSIDVVNLGEELADQAWYRANYARLYVYHNPGTEVSELVDQAWETNQFFESALSELKTGDYDIQGHGTVIAILDSQYLRLINGEEPEHMLATGTPDMALIYLICEYYSLDFWQILTNNIAKLQVRYPDKFTNEAALNRNLDAERVELEKTTMVVSADEDGINIEFQQDPGDEHKKSIFFERDPDADIEYLHKHSRKSDNSEE